MNRLLTGIALTGAMLAASPVPAVESANQSILLKKQIAACMTKRMLADRTITYNDAKKACADALKGAGAALNHSPSALTAASNSRLAR